METKPRVGMGRAFTLFFKNYGNFRGRSTRSEYWYMFLWQLLFIGLFFAYLIRVTSVILARNKQGFSLNLLVSFLLPLFLFIVIALILVVPLVALHVRRYRDAGISPWWLLVTYLLPMLLSHTEIVGVNSSLGDILTTVALVLEIANWVLAAQPSKRTIAEGV